MPLGGSTPQARSIGILLACIVFSVRYARVPFVKHRLSLAEWRSNVGRSPEATPALSNLGRSVPILQLQGYLVFGTTYGLQQRVKKMLAGARAVVLDFKLVSGLDSSAALGLRKMNREAAECAPREFSGRDRQRGISRTSIPPWSIARTRS